MAEERFEFWCDGCGDTTFVAQVEEADAGGALEVRVREARCEGCDMDVTAEVQDLVDEKILGGLALPWGPTPVPVGADDGGMFW